jgi:hypothetical protein
VIEKKEKRKNNKTWLLISHNRCYCTYKYVCRTHIVRKIEIEGAIDKMDVEAGCWQLFSFSFTFGDNM